MPKSSDTPPPPAGHVEVARDRQAVLFHVVGLATMHLSGTMSEFAESMLEMGYRHFAIDLAACTGMDSTFMGTIVGISTHVRREGGWTCLVNAHGDNRRLLETIGVWGLVPVKETFPIEAVEMETLLPGGDAKKRIETIKQAHEHLVAIDERNRERFGAFLSMLEQEMEPNGSERQEEEADGSSASSENASQSFVT